MCVILTLEMILAARLHVSSHAVRSDRLLHQCDAAAWGNADLAFNFALARSRIVVSVHLVVETK